MSSSKSLVDRGPRAKTFTFALRLLNREILIKGRSKIFSKGDARTVFHQYGGKCAYCGIPLVPRGKKENSLRLTLYVPLRYGGQVEIGNLLPVCVDCRDKNNIPPKRMMDRLPNVNTIADLVDRLIVEVHKLAWFENKKREEHQKDFPDRDLIVEWDASSRDCCELRSMLKRELNLAIEEAVVALRYVPRKERRTFSPPKIAEGHTIADTVDHMCENGAARCFPCSQEPPSMDDRNAEIKRELVDQIQGLQLTKNARILKVDEA